VKLTTSKQQSCPIFKSLKTPPIQFTKCELDHTHLPKQTLFLELCHKKTVIYLTITDLQYVWVKTQFKQ